MKLNKLITINLLILTLTFGGCSTLKSIFAPGQKDEKQGPISNPFYDYSNSKQSNGSVIYRSKKADRSVELEIPTASADHTDFVMPMNPNFRDQKKNQASGDTNIDDSYKDKKASVTDREIVSTLPQSDPQYNQSRQEIETGLGVMAAEDETPQSDSSYLGAMDHVKQLFKAGRYEAALLETDEIMRNYPTDPKVYEMRGTLYDRTGRSDLALKSWNQALKLDPNNVSLKKYVDRKQAKRALASEGKL